MHEKILFPNEREENRNEIEWFSVSFSFACLFRLRTTDQEKYHAYLFISLTSKNKFVQRQWENNKKKNAKQSERERHKTSCDMYVRYFASFLGGI